MRVFYFSIENYIDSNYTFHNYKEKISEKGDERHCEKFYWSYQEIKR